MYLMLPLEMGGGIAHSEHLSLQALLLWPEDKAHTFACNRGTGC